MKQKVSKLLILVLTVLVLPACSLGVKQDGTEIPNVTNVTLGKPATASSQTPNYGPDGALDGVTTENSSRWVTDKDALPPHWMEIDLQGTFVLERAEIWNGLAGEGRYTVAHMKLQYDVNGEWVDIPGAIVTNNTSDPAKLEFANPVTTGKVRFVSETAQSGDGSGLRIREIMIFGVPHKD